MMLNPQYRIFEGRDLMTWRDNGACLDEDPELFFAIGNTGPVLRQICCAR